MRSVVLHNPNRIELTTTSEPAQPGPSEALVRVLRVGVCGTDIHAYLGNQPMMVYPVILGHELAVEVLALGADTGGLGIRPRDRCTVVPYVNCGSCGACARGRTNACERLSVLGVHEDGGLRERFVLPARLLIPANDLNHDQLALTEMLAIGEHAAARADLLPNDTVAVIGAGPIGLSTIAAARQRTTSVVGLDLSASRLAFLASTGLAEPVPAEGEVESQLRQHLGGDLPTVVIDATGNASSMQAAASLVAPGGRLVFVGHTKHDLTFANPLLHRRELSILASRNATRTDFENVLASLRSGAIDIAPWINARVDPAGFVRELPRWAKGPSEVVKAVVEFA